MFTGVLIFEIRKSIYETQMEPSWLKSSIYDLRWVAFLFKIFTNIPRKIASFASSKRSDWCHANGNPFSLFTLAITYKVFCKT